MSRSIPGDLPVDKYKKIVQDGSKNLNYPAKQERQQAARHHE
jgi:hypothetical protein